MFKKWYYTHSAREPIPYGFTYSTIMINDTIIYKHLCV